MAALIDTLLAVASLLLVIAGVTSAGVSLHKVTKAGRLEFGDPDRLRDTLLAFAWMATSACLLSIKGGIGVYQSWSTRSELHECQSALKHEYEIQEQEP